MRPNAVRLLACWSLGMVESPASHKTMTIVAHVTTIIRFIYAIKAHTQLLMTVTPFLSYCDSVHGACEYAYLPVNLLIIILNTEKTDIV